MFRKTLIAATAVAAFAATAFVSTSADAGWRHRHRGHGWVPFAIGSVALTAAIIAAQQQQQSQCVRPVWIETEEGPRQVMGRVC